jgi:hypothetical protein
MWAWDNQPFANLSAVLQQWDIEVVHVGVGQQHQVNGRKLGKRHCGMHQPLDAKREGTEMDAGFGAENRIRQNREAIQANQHRAVANPGGIQTAIRPAAEIRTKQRSLDIALQVSPILIPERARNEPVESSPRQRRARAAKPQASQQPPA